MPAIRVTNARLSQLCVEEGLLLGTEEQSAIVYELLLLRQMLAAYEVRDHPMEIDIWHQRLHRMYLLYRDHFPKDPHADP